MLVSLLDGGDERIQVDIANDLLRPDQARQTTEWHNDQERYGDSKWSADVASTAESE